MTFDTIRQGLRWTFWVLLWLMTALLGAVLFLATVPVAAPLRWAMFAVVLGIVAEDVRRKMQPTPAPSVAGRRGRWHRPPGERGVVRLPADGRPPQPRVMVTVVVERCAVRARIPSEAAATSTRTTSRPRS